MFQRIRRLLTKKERLDNLTRPEKTTPLQDKELAEKRYTELRLAVGDQLIADLLTERRWNRRWTFTKRAFYLILFIVTTVFYLMFWAKRAGYEALPTQPSVAIVPIEGPIMSGGRVSADAIVPTLERVLNAKNIQGVILQLKTPGGAPGESERIIHTIEYYKKKFPDKKIVAACDTICASAGYMIAVHADKVYAGKYAFIGSIGAIMQNWDWHGLVEFLKVDQRVFTSGPLKDAGNSFKEMPDIHRQKLQSLVDESALLFVNDVKQHRPALANDKNLFTGEVWTAPEALRYGLIDQVASLEEVSHLEFPDVPTRRFVPQLPQGPSLMETVFGAAPDIVIANALTRVFNSSVGTLQ